MSITIPADLSLNTQDALHWVGNAQVAELWAMMTGFDDAEWRTRAREAISMLRAAAEAVRNGDETPCMTGPGIYDFSEPREVRLDDYWNASDQFRRVLSLSRIEAEALRQKFPAPSAAAQASSPAASSSGPRFPRGTVFTRPLTGSTT